MKYHGGWSLLEIYNLPIGLRNWLAERLTNQLKEEAENIKKK
jgi:hypothetical protein